jgi:hypothetical protein
LKSNLKARSNTTALFLTAIFTLSCFTFSTCYFSLTPPVTINCTLLKSVVIDMMSLISHSAKLR